MVLDMLDVPSRGVIPGVPVVTVVPVGRMVPMIPNVGVMTIVRSV